MSSINKPATEWTDEELLGWARGELSPSGQASNRTVARECIARFGFESTDDIEAVRALVLVAFDTQTEEPESPVEESAETPEPEDDVSDEPVEEDAPATPEETPEVPEVPEETPVPETPVQTPGTPESDPEPETDDGAPEMPDDEVLVKPIPLLMSQADMTREIIENNLASYAKTMAPNVQVSTQEGANKQVVLYRTFQTVLRTEGVEFTKNLDLLLKFIATNHEDLFTEERAFRFLQYIRLPASDRKTFERLLNLFIGTAARETRAMALKQVDLGRTIESLDAEAQQRLIEYYSV